MQTPKLPTRASDDLFEGSAMTFGQHLEELRKALVKSSLWLAGGVMIGLLLANSVVRFIQTPLQTALADYYLDLDANKLEKMLGSKELPPALVQWVRQHKLVSEFVWLDPAQITDPSEKSPLGGAEVKQQPAETTTDPATDLPPGSQKTQDPAPNVAGGTQPKTTSVNSIPPATATNVSYSSADKTDQDSDVAQATPNVSTKPGEKPVAVDKQTVANPETQAPEAQKPVVATSDTPKPDMEEVNEETSMIGNVSLTTRQVEMMVDSINDPGLTKRLRPVMLWRGIETKLSTFDIQESFMIWLKAGLVAGLVLASPGIFWHLWSFVAAGLYPHERRYVYFFLPLSLSLFLFGVFLAFFVIFQFVLKFLLTYNSSMGIDITPRLNAYISFALFLPLGFGIAFQLPLVMLFLQRIGVFSVELYLSKWRVAILVICFISMILTPAELSSMIGMAVPLVGLYFFGIALCHYLPSGRGIGAGGYDPQG